MRRAEVIRRTKETDIRLAVNLDGGPVEVSTGIGFFDHMLQSFAFHAGFGLKAEVKGDTHVDAHHTVEDTGIALGQALREALGEKIGIARFSCEHVPMDEALARAAVDISGRPFLRFDAEFPQAMIGAFDSCLTEEFMRALCFNGMFTLHLSVLYGNNAHHMTEALFKACALALKRAFSVEGDGVPSTKGVL